MADPARLRAALAGRYAIERELGAGGMATVYLARDLKHDRAVALKVLRPELAAILGAERFLHEIKTTANLQHPHILPLHDSGEVDGFVFYVMPLVEGESLRERLTREKQLAVDDAVRITREVASALDYAHRHGVVHRDIKPENILLHDGQALVADFGIALAVSTAGAGPRLTETGISLGTPHYMSPEQAMGEREITPRSDIYALGCVLYEMLVGEPPFTGPTAQAIVAKVVTDEPRPITIHRRTVPEHIEAAVLRALAKLPADRFRSVAEFADALADGAHATAPPLTRFVATGVPTWWRAAALALGGLAILFGAVTGWFLLRPRSAAGPTVYDVALPDSAPLLFADGPVNFDVSPAGDFVVYTAGADSNRTELWLLSLKNATARPIPGTHGAKRPSISPDGRRVAFFAEGRLRIMPIAGGPATTIAEEGFGNIRWVSPARMLLVDNDGTRLRWFDPEGGETERRAVDYCIMAEPLPDGRLLCGGGGDKHGHIRNLRNGSVQKLFGPRSDGTDSVQTNVRGSHFRIVDGEYLTYMSVEGELRAAPIDLETGRVGRSVTLIPGVRREAYSGAGAYAITRSGALVYVSGDNAEVGRLVKWRPGRSPEPLPVEPAAYLRYDISADGHWLAAAVEGVREQELRVYDLRTGHGQVWLRATGVGEPLWSPDGRRLITSLDSSLVIGSPTSAAPPDTLLRNIFFGALAYRPDDVIVGGRYGTGQALAIDLKVRPVAVDTLLEDAAFSVPSPNGKWIAYNSAGLDRMWLAPLPADGRRWPVAGNEDPQWLSSSELLTFTQPTWYLQLVDGRADPPVGEPRIWFRDPRYVATPGQSYTVTPDGGVVYLQGTARTTAGYLRVVPNWVAEMKRAVDQANGR